MQYQVCIQVSNHQQLNLKLSVMPLQHNRCPRCSICQHFLSKWLLKQKITLARPKTIEALLSRTLINLAWAVMFLLQECLESGSRAECLKIWRESKRAMRRHMRSWSQCIEKCSWGRNIDLVLCLYKLLNSLSLCSAGLAFNLCLHKLV